MIKIVHKIPTEPPSSLHRYFIYADEELVGYALRESNGFRFVKRPDCRIGFIPDTIAPQTMKALKEQLARLIANYSPADRIWDEFVDLVTELSPENLSCDGEASSSYMSEKRRRIARRWKELEKDIGHDVSEDEVWNWYQEKRS